MPDAVVNDPGDMHLAIVATMSPNPLATKVRASLDETVLQGGDLDPGILAIRGSSGRKYRIFINRLIRSLDDPRYLEVGVLRGSTLCSAIHNNKVRALGIDNWSQFGGPAGEFFANLSRYRGGAAVSFLDIDFRQVDYSAIGKFNVYFFDGPHRQQDQYDGVKIALPALDQNFVLIIDDWNWQRVRDGTFQAVKDACLRLDFAAEIRTTLDDSHPRLSHESSDWHNGYFIAVCAKQASG